jgi:uncharacterized membrane protein
VSTIFSHIRNKLVAGVFAAIPLVICIYVAMWLETHTKVLTAPLGFHFPGLGFLIVLVGVYLLGVAVTSYLGRFSLKLLDWAVGKVPGLKIVAKVWKDVLVVSPEKSGMFHQAVLVPVEGNNHQVGFTSGQDLPGAADHLCVFLPNLPNPFAGKLIVVRRSVCTPLDLTVEEALKYQLSSGNYLPRGLAVKTPESA